MRAVIQRVSEASVTIPDELAVRVETGRIGVGLLALVGAGAGDTVSDAEYIADKIAGLRVFEDEAGKMNLALGDVGGAVLVVSQFTLFGDVRKGRRPAFTEALEPVAAEQLVGVVVDQLRAAGLTVATGKFRATMRVSLVNEGPVTILLDSRKAF